MMPASSPPKQKLAGVLERAALEAGEHGLKRCKRAGLTRSSRPPRPPQPALPPGAAGAERGEGAAAGAAKQSTGSSPIASSAPIAAYQANKALACVPLPYFTIVAILASAPIFVIASAQRAIQYPRPFA